MTYGGEELRAVSAECESRSRAGSEFNEEWVLSPIATTGALVLFSLVLFTVGELVAWTWSGSPELRMLSSDVRSLVFAYPLVVPLACLALLGQTAGGVAALACLVHPELVFAFASSSWSLSPLAAFALVRDGSSSAALVDRAEISQLFAR